MNIHSRRFVATLLATFTLLLSFSATAQTFTSGKQKVQLVELFTSQGCSSCPPAQRWLNKLNDSAELWNTVVPIAFHVDYWDYLGWKDPYSTSKFSNRQRNYKRLKHARSVYTPGFFVNGQEWTGFFKRANLPLQKQSAPELKVSFDGDKLSASFESEQQEPLILNVAVLGMELITPVTAGENRNRKLTESFVVLDHITLFTVDNQWQSKLSFPDNIPKLALAAWVNKQGEPNPLQATGGVIKQ